MERRRYCQGFSYHVLPSCRSNMYCSLYELSIALSIAIRKACRNTRNPLILHLTSMLRHLWLHVDIIQPNQLKSEQDSSMSLHNTQNLDTISPDLFSITWKLRWDQVDTRCNSIVKTQTIYSTWAKS